jgi:hypothetical protein
MSDVSCDSRLWLSCSAIGVMAGIALAVLPAVRPAERPLRLAEAVRAEATGIAPRIAIVTASPVELQAAATAAGRYLLTPQRIASVARLRAPETGGRLPHCDRCPRSSVSLVRDRPAGALRRPGNPAGGKSAVP